MNILNKLFGKKPDLPFRVGDKVRDLWGNIAEVTGIDAGAERGLGIVRTRDAKGKESTVALITHNLTLVDRDTPLSAPSFEVKRANPDESAASAYLRAGKIVIHGVCVTNFGGLSCEPYTSIEATVSDETLGTELLRILTEAKATPTPTEMKSHLKAEEQKLFKVFDVRSRTKLREGAAYCYATQKSEEISFIPTQNENRGFAHLTALISKIPNASKPAEVGSALRKSFLNCA